MTSTAVCLFSKPPEAGLAKTRLATAVGLDGAAALARAFLVDTWRTLRGLPWAHPIFATTAPVPDDPAALLGDHAGAVDVIVQGEGDLGARLESVLRAALARSQAAIVIGGDSPGLPARLLDAARRALATGDAVIGPADDGGFYLLGLTRCPAGLLAGLPWSCSDTGARTAAALAGAGFTVTTLEPWFDVDTPDDLRALAGRLARGEITAPSTALALAVDTAGPARRS